MFVKCPTPGCDSVYDDSITNKCPRCKPSNKRVVLSREDKKFAIGRCAHDTPLSWTCIKCERTEEDTRVYRNHLLVEIKQLLIEQKRATPKDAWTKALAFLATIEEQLGKEYDPNAYPPRA